MVATIKMFNKTVYNTEDLQSLYAKVVEQLHGYSSSNTIKVCYYTPTPPEKLSQMSKRKPNPWKYVRYHKKQGPKSWKQRPTLSIVRPNKLYDSALETIAATLDEVPTLPEHVLYELVSAISTFHYYERGAQELKETPAWDWVKDFKVRYRFRKKRATLKERLELEELKISQISTKWNEADSRIRFHRDCLEKSEADEKRYSEAYYKQNAKLRDLRAKIDAKEAKEQPGLG